MADNDYKHVLHDMTNLYIGAKLSYDELMNIDAVPHKFKSVLDHTILNEIDRSTTLENHLFFIKKDDLSYRVYERLHARFRLNVFSDGKYISKEYGIEEIVESETFHKDMNTIFVEELHIPKLYLLGAITGEKKEKKKKPVNVEDYIDEFLGEQNIDED